jgi:hypothetical protein
MSSAFKLPVDIANRGCQRLGALRILTDDFSEDSQQAAEMGACYDACRESELRRNLWTFATKRDVLRPVDLATQLWTPPDYAAATTYALGEITVDTDGEWWQSKKRQQHRQRADAGLGLLGALRRLRCSFALRHAFWRRSISRASW